MIANLQGQLRNARSVMATGTRNSQIVQLKLLNATNVKETDTAKCCKSRHKISFNKNTLDSIMIIIDNVYVEVLDINDCEVDMVVNSGASSSVISTAIAKDNIGDV